MSKILKNLFLGDVLDAANHKTLQSLNIRCILIIAKEIPPFHSRGFTYMKINAHDHAQFDIKKQFRETLPFINRQIDKGGVLVHCYDGVSRSATIVIAYLMRYKNMSLQKALDYVKSRRNIKPNDGFMRQLQEMDYDLTQKTRSQILYLDSEQPSSRKRSRNPKTPKFAIENDQRHAELLAKYMKQREGSKSVTKTYCQMLQVYKKIKQPNVQVNTASKSKHLLNKVTKSIKNKHSLLAFNNKSHKLGFNKMHIAMKTLDTDELPYKNLKNKSKNPKTNKDRSVPKLVSVTQRFLSCEKATINDTDEGIEGKKKTILGLSFENQKGFLKEILKQSSNQSQLSNNKSEFNKSKKNDQNSKLINSISSNFQNSHKARVPGIKSHSNSVHSYLENNCELTQNARTKGQISDIIKSKKNKYKNSISPTTTTKMKGFKGIRNSDPVLDGLSNNFKNKLNRRPPKVL